MGLSEVLLNKREEILRVAGLHGARSVRIFGSVARGEAGPDSDLDLLVELTPDRSLLDIIAIQQDLEDLLRRKVHVLTEAAVSPYFREAVLKEAVDL